MKKYRRGYTTGVFDMFHIGHLNLIKNSTLQCEELIVGVTTDSLVSYKNTEAIIPHSERMEIVRNVKGVTEVVSQETMDKMEAWKRLKFDVMFVGSDWEGSATWNRIEQEFLSVGVDIVYLPYTKGTSSTKLREVLATITQVKGS